MPVRWKCMFNRHEPDRARVSFEFTAMSSRCIRCGAPIRRVRHKLWVREPGAADRSAPERRSASPR